MNPCCCLDLKSGICILVFMDVVLNGVGVFLLASSLAKYEEYKYDYREMENYYGVSHSTIVAIYCVNIGFGMLSIGLAIFLYVSAKNDSHRGCVVWFILNILFVAQDIAQVVLGYTTVFQKPTFMKVMEIIGLIYHLYKMIVVFFFIREVRGQEIAVGPDGKVREEEEEEIEGLPPMSV